VVHAKLKHLPTPGATVSSSTAATFRSSAALDPGAGCTEAAFCRAAATPDATSDPSIARASIHLPLFKRDMIEPLPRPEVGATRLRAPSSDLSRGSIWQSTARASRHDLLQLGREWVLDRAARQHEGADPKGELEFTVVSADPGEK